MGNRGPEVSEKTRSKMYKSKVNSRRWRASLEEVTRWLGREEAQQGIVLSKGNSCSWKSSFLWEYQVNAKHKINFWLFLCIGETSWPQEEGSLDVQPTMVSYLQLKFTHSFDLPTLLESQGSLPAPIWAHSLIFNPLEGKERKWKHWQDHGRKSDRHQFTGMGREFFSKNSEDT